MYQYIVSYSIYTLSTLRRCIDSVFSKTILVKALKYTMYPNIVLQCILLLSPRVVLDPGFLLFVVVVFLPPTGRVLGTISDICLQFVFSCLPMLRDVINRL